MHTAPYFATLGFLTVYHAIRVIRVRRQFQIGLGDGGNPLLERRIRIFGNHIEFAPLGLILLIGLEFVQAPIWYMHLCGGLLVIGRMLHAMGLEKTNRYSAGRTFGMLMTFGSLILSSIGVLIFTWLMRS